MSAGCRPAQTRRVAQAAAKLAPDARGFEDRAVEIDFETCLSW